MRRRVYFTGKNLGRVADSEDEDEDLQADVIVPEEFLAADAEVNVADPDHGASETDCDLGRSKSIVKVIGCLRLSIHMLTDSI